MIGEAEVLCFVGFGNRKTDLNPEQMQKIGGPTHCYFPNETKGVFKMSIMVVSANPDWQNMSPNALVHYEYAVHCKIPIIAKTQLRGSLNSDASTSVASQYSAT